MRSLLFGATLRREFYWKESRYCQEKNRYYYVSINYVSINIKLQVYVYKRNKLILSSCLANAPGKQVHYDYGDGFQWTFSSSLADADGRIHYCFSFAVKIARVGYDILPERRCTYRKGKHLASFTLLIPSWPQMGTATYNKNCRLSYIDHYIFSVHRVHIV